MGATNTTTNYGLPIFIETDKPAWLVDFNGAMRSIDTQMKTNADAIATKSPILTFNDTTDIDFTKSDNIITANLSSGVSDKVGRALITPLSAPAADQMVMINTDGQQENVTIGSGLNVSSGTVTAVDLNINQFDDSTTFTASGVTVTGNMHIATNTDKSIGKIWGIMTVTKSTSGNTSVDIDTGFTIPNSTASVISMTVAGLANDMNQYRFNSPQIRIDTNNKVYIRITAYGQSETYVRIWPCVYFFKDFGDS